MFPLAFIARSLQGHWWGFISWNYVVWPIFFLVNVFIALKGTHFLFLLDRAKNIYPAWKFWVGKQQTNKHVFIRLALRVVADEASDDGSSSVRPLLLRRGVTGDDIASIPVEKIDPLLLFMRVHHELCNCSEWSSEPWQD